MENGWGQDVESVSKVPKDRKVGFILYFLLPVFCLYMLYTMYSDTIKSKDAQIKDAIECCKELRKENKSLRIENHDLYKENEGLRKEPIKISDSALKKLIDIEKKLQSR